MKTLFSLLIGLSIIGAGTILDRDSFRIDSDDIPYTQLKDVYNTEALIEMGAMLYGDDKLSPFGVGSCETCHAKGNHLAPPKGSQQISLGGYTDHLGNIRTAKYYPAGWVLDAPKINSPQAENLVFRKQVLHDGITDRMGQASEKFGLWAHNLDWTAIQNDEVYLHYTGLIWGNQKITQERVSKALVTFQESCVSTGNDFQDWAAGKDQGPAFNNWLDLMETKCFNCHSGKDLGGEGLTSGKVVYKDGTDISFLRSETVLTRSLYNSNAFDAYGWVGDYTTTAGFLSKHVALEGIEISKAEERQAVRGIRKYLND